MPANDTSGRPGLSELCSSVLDLHGLWPTVSSGVMRIEFWQSRVKVASCCLTLSASHVTPASLVPSAPLLLPLSPARQNKSRWQSQVVVHDSYGRGDAGRCRELLCVRGNHPGRPRLVLHHLPTSTPSQLRDGDVTTCCHLHQTDPWLGISS